MSRGTPHDALSASLILRCVFCPQEKGALSVSPALEASFSMCLPVGHLSKVAVYSQRAAKSGSFLLSYVLFN